MIVLKVGKLFFKLTAPSIIGMLVYAFYNVVDTIFVGRALGEELVGTTVFQALGKSKPAFFLSLARQLLFLLPLVLVLPKYYQLDGVWASFPI